jgi:flavorubredoxin
MTEAAPFQDLKDVCALAVGSSTRIKKPLPTIRELLTVMTGLSGLAAASFGSYGWSGEAPDVIADVLKSKGARLIQEQPLKAKDYPGEQKLDECRALGRRLARECKP